MEATQDAERLSKIMGAERVVKDASGDYTKRRPGV